MQSIVKRTGFNAAIGMMAIFLLLGAGCSSNGVNIDKAMEVCERFPETDLKYTKNLDTGKYESTSVPSTVTKEECIDSALKGENPYSK